MQKSISFLPVLVVFLLLSLLLISTNKFFSGVAGALGLGRVTIIVQETTRAIFPFFQGNEDPETSSSLSKMHEAAVLATTSQEMQALRDQFETASIPSKHLLPAKIIGFVGFLPGVSRPTEIIIDKGSSEGVESGLAVIYKDNLVGKVTKVASNRSLISLLSKSEWSFTAKTGKSNANGLVSIEGGDMLLKNVVLSDTLTAKDVVLTKGDEALDGGGFPPDIVVGEIASVDKKASSLFQTARVKSLIDVTKLSTVFVYLQK